MQYNLTHRGAVIKTFDTNEMDPVEISEMKKLTGDYFKIERATPDRLEPLPDDYSQLDSVRADYLAWGNRGHYRTGVQNHALLRL